MDATHAPAELCVIAILDRDIARSDTLAGALRAEGWSVIVRPETDELPPGCVVLFAPDREPGALRGLVTRLRGASPVRQVLAVSAVGTATAEGREILAATQAAGCDGCLVYAHPSEVSSVLRACVVSPCV